MFGRLTSAWFVTRRRARTDWLFLGAAAILVGLTTALLAAGPMLADAVTSNALTRTLLDAPAQDTGVTVSSRADGREVEALVPAVVAVFDGTVGRWNHPASVSGRSPSYTSPALAAQRTVTALAFVDDLAGHVDVIAGRAPEPGANPPEAWAAADAAEAFPVADIVTVVDRDGRTSDVEVVGHYAARDPDSAFWWGDAALRDGVVAGESFTTVGPLVLAREDFAAVLADDRVTVDWRAPIDPTAVGTGDQAAVRAGVAALDAGVDALGRGPAAGVDSELPALLAAAAQGATVTRTAVLVILVQLVVLGVYALSLAAAALTEVRAVELSLVQARGADRADAVSVATLEALALTVPAVALAPWIAAGGLRALGVVGVLPGFGLALTPAVTALAYVTAGAAGAAAVAALVGPSLANRAFRATLTGRGRQGRPWIQRVGLDLALVVVALLGLWQLRRYDSPLIAGIRGDLQVDPLLVAAPGLGLAAGAILVMRVVPWLAGTAAQWVGRTRRFALALGAWQLGRRPAYTVRIVLLLAMAVAIGTFAATYATTWNRSQADQAALQVGADARVEPSRRTGPTLTALALPVAYAGLDGVTGVAAVDESRATVAGATVTLVAADLGAGVVDLRDDLVAGPHDLAALHRPTVLPTVPLPGPADALRLRVTVREEVASLAPGRQPRLLVYLQGPDGGLHALDPGPLAADGRSQVLEVALGRAVEGVALAGVDLRVPSGSRAQVTLDGLQWGDTEVPLTAAWTATALVRGAVARPAAGATASPDACAGVVIQAAPLDLAADDTGAVAVCVAAEPSLAGSDTIRLLPGAAAVPEPTPALVHPSVLASTGARPGDDVAARIGSTTVQLAVRGTVTAAPTLADAGGFALVDRPTLAAALYAAGIQPPGPDAYLLDVADPDAVPVAVLGGPPFDSVEVVTRADAARTLRTDPVVLGVIGALTLAFLAAGGFALVGYGVAATVATRQRHTEFALLRALGSPERELQRWMAVEIASVVVLATLVGVAVGIGLGAAVLPQLALGADGIPVVPSPRLVVPWAALAGVSGAAVAFLLAGPPLLVRVVGRGEITQALRTGESR